MPLDQYYKRIDNKFLSPLSFAVVAGFWTTLMEEEVTYRSLLGVLFGLLERNKMVGRWYCVIILTDY